MHLLGGWRQREGVSSRPPTKHGAHAGLHPTTLSQNQEQVAPPTEPPSRPQGTFRIRSSAFFLYPHSCHSPVCETPGPLHSAESPLESSSRRKLTGRQRDTQNRLEPPKSLRGAGRPCTACLATNGMAWQGPASSPGTERSGGLPGQTTLPPATFSRQPSSCPCHSCQSPLGEHGTAAHHVASAETPPQPRGGTPPSPPCQPQPPAFERHPLLAILPHTAHLFLSPSWCLRAGPPTEAPFLDSAACSPSGPPSPPAPPQLAPLGAGDGRARSGLHAVPARSGLPHACPPPPWSAPT